MKDRALERETLAWLNGLESLNHLEGIIGDLTEEEQSLLDGIDLSMHPADDDLDAFGSEFVTRLVTRSATAVLASQVERLSNMERQADAATVFHGGTRFFELLREVEVQPDGLEELRRTVVEAQKNLAPLMVEAYAYAVGGLASRRS